MRWGVVGTGAISTHFAVACAAVPGAEIVAVASRDAARGADFLRRYGRGTTCVDSPAALAALETVDVVYIASPNKCHVADACAVMAAGKPVLCEKPLAIDPAGAQQVIAAARAADVFCMEGIKSLFQPAYQAGKAAVAAGEIGALREIQASFCVPQSPATMPRLFEGAAGGGALLDRGCYLLALAGFLAGPLTLEQAAIDRDETGLDLAATLILRGADGADGVRIVLSCALDRLGRNDLTLLGTRGRIDFAAPVTEPRAVQRLSHDPEAAFAPLRPKGGLGDALKGQINKRPRLLSLARTLRARQTGFAGGMEFQIREVEACLAAGRRESAVLPLQMSQDIQRLIAEARPLAGSPGATGPTPSGPAA